MASLITATMIDTIVQDLTAAIKLGRLNVGDLTSLNTTAKNTIVASINEVQAAVASASGVDDATPGSTTTAYSASKVESELDAHLAEANTYTDTEAAAAETAAITAAGTYTDSAIAALTILTLADIIDDTNAAATDRSYSAAKVEARMVELLDDLGGEAGIVSALASLGAADASALSAIGNKLDYSQSQSLSGPQQTQALANLGHTIDTTDWAAEVATGLA